MVELLAPAGELNSGFAAFQYGADAVYLGMGKFSARAEAVNFTPEELSFLTRYAHAHGKRVLVAVNTLVFNDEFRDLAETLYDIGAANVDGVIVQDLGVARFIRKNFPTLRLHASTQAAVHNEQGAAALKELGFKRVVLARELTFDEIAHIAKNVAVETEVFIHGALCYSYSGLCQFSALCTGRSANRGKCVYPCRESVSFDDENGFAFSMRDLALEENILRLKEIGVSALKIEGRKKTPLYTAALSDLYRYILNGAPDKKLLARKKTAVRTIFSRKTTTLYTKDRFNDTVADTSITGHRGLPLGVVEKVFSKRGERFISFTPTVGFERYDGIQIDLENVPKPYGFSAQKLLSKDKNVFQAVACAPVAVALPEDAPFIAAKRPVYLASCAAVKKAYPLSKPNMHDYGEKQRISVFVTLDKNGVYAAADDQGVEISTQLSAAKKIETVEKSVRQAFEKTGETNFAVENITIVNPLNLFAPASVLNEIRRSLYAKLKEKQVQKQTAKRRAAVESALRKSNVASIVSKPENKRFFIKTDDAENLKALTPADFEAIDEVIYEITPAFKNLPDVPKEKLRLALPVLCRGWEKKRLNDLIANLTNAGMTRWETSNPWGVSALDFKKCSVTAGETLYVANTQAAKALSDIGFDRFTVSFETPDPKALYAAFPDKAVALVRRDTPLFISETCPRKTIHGECLKCETNFNLPLSSRYGKFEAVGRSCRFRLLRANPQDCSTEVLKENARLWQADFTYRKPNPESVRDTVKKFIQKMK